MLSVIDCNNFWSPSGGGVRRYHLQKLEYMKQRSDVKYIFVMNDSRTFSEQINETTFIEHVKTPKFPGNWDYRHLVSPLVLARIFKKYEVDVVEIGSPYAMPLMVRIARFTLKKKPVIVGFWHADFPVTYVKRIFYPYSKGLAALLEKIAWIFARVNFTWMDRVFVSSAYVMNRMNKNGINNTAFLPLGVDAVHFSPEKKDPELVCQLKAGNEKRLTIFFPHRFCEEKGLLTFLQVYPAICSRLGVEPAVVFAGTGPFLQQVKDAAQKFEHVRYIGFVNSRDEMARYYASCEVGLALSGWETFGLSILEAMASGQALVGANTGAAGEHIESSRGGVSISPGDGNALVEALARISHPGKLLAMGQNARSYALTLGWDKCFCDEILQYELLVKSPNLD